MYRSPIDKIVGLLLCISKFVIFDLTPRESDVKSGLFSVAENEDQIVGFYGFSTEEEEPEMNFLFVTPELKGKGFGKSLWNHAVEFARDRKWKSFFLCADPFAAENFYDHVGCLLVGEVSSVVRPGRKLPLYRFCLQT